MNNYNKAIFAAVATAFVTVVVWLLEMYGVIVPDNVKTAFITLATAAFVGLVVYIVPNGENAIKYLLTSLTKK